MAAETALRAGPGGGWEGRSVAIEGFGKAGGGAAREVTSRGGRVVAVSTVAGCVVDASGLDVERLLALRHVHGDACVRRYGLPAEPPSRLFTAVDADVVIPGARPGVISRRVAESLPSAVRVVAPAANVPYTKAPDSQSESPTEVACCPATNLVWVVSLLLADRRHTRRGITHQPAHRRRRARPR